MPDRVFVPLAKEPYKWFASGEKSWELRRYGRQFTTRTIWPGRRVELRHGYAATSHILWGTITEVVSAAGLNDFFSRVPFQAVIPVAKDRGDAIARARSILRLDANDLERLIGFRVALDHRP